MTNTNKLKGKIVENGYTITSLAKELDISKVTLSQKINNKVRFSQNDIKALDEKLNFTGDDIKQIFLE